MNEIVHAAFDTSVHVLPLDSLLPTRPEKSRSISDRG